MQKGFTLIEVMFATLVIVTILSATLYAIGHSLTAQETIQDMSLAMSAARAQIENLRNQSFGLLTEGTSTFNPNGLDGKGRIEISKGSLTGGGTTDTLMNIRVVVSWRQKGGRIIGEDNGAGGGTALNGQLDGAEDANANNRLDSPCAIETSIANMGI